MYHIAEIVRDAKRDMQQRYEGSTWSTYTPFPFLYALTGQITQTMQRKAPDVLKRVAVSTCDQIADVAFNTQYKMREVCVTCTQNGQKIFYQMKTTAETVPLPGAIAPIRGSVVVPFFSAVEGFAQFVTSEELPELYFVAKNRMGSNFFLRHLVLPPLGAMESVVQYVVILPTQMVFPSREEIEFRTDLFLDVSTSRVQAVVEYLYSATEVFDQHWSMVQWNILGRGPYESLSPERRAEVIKGMLQRMKIVTSKFKRYEFMASIRIQNEMLYHDLLDVLPKDEAKDGLPLTEKDIESNAQLIQDLEEHACNSFPCWFYCKLGTTNEWIEFPPHESRRLERCYRQYHQNHQKQNKTKKNKKQNIVLVDEGRHEVWFDRMEMKPVYWPKLEIQKVRRSLWLYAERNYGIAPYDPIAAQELEQAFIYYLAHYEEEKQAALSQAIASSKRSRPLPVITPACPLDVPVEGHLVEIKSPIDMMQYKRLLAGTTPFTSKRRVYRGDPRIKADAKSLEVWQQVVLKKNPLFIQEDDQDIEEEIDHLVLIVHGIGDALKTIDLINVVQLRSIIDCASNLREQHKEAVKSNHFDGFEGKKRVEFLPIEWHSKLHRRSATADSESESTNLFKATCSSSSSSSISDEETEIESNTTTNSEFDFIGPDEGIRDVTLPAIPKLREFANDTILDVLFFMSPSFHRIICEQVTKEMNRVYQLFIQRNKNWKKNQTQNKKKVSIIAHSLGAIICFDILSNQQPLLSKKKTENHVKEKNFKSSASSTHHLRSMPILIPSTEFSSSSPFSSRLSKARSLSEPEYVLNTTLEAAMKHEEEEDLLVKKKYPSREKFSSHGSSSQETEVEDKEMISFDGLNGLNGTFSKNTKQPYTTTTSTSSRNTKKKKKEDTNYVGSHNLGPFYQKEPMVYPPLDFEVENIFCFGSPISLFLNVRSQKLAPTYQLPTCKRLYNIYHPYDPVAYRMEPLIHKHRVHSKAAIIHTFEGKLRFQYKIRNTFRATWRALRRWKRDFEATVERNVRKIGLVEASPHELYPYYYYPSTSTPMTTPSPLIPQYQVHRSSQPQALAQASHHISLSVSPDNMDMRMYPCTERKETNLEEMEEYGRLCEGQPIDYSLQENEIEITNEYLFALTAHVIYWTNRDASLFVAKKLLNLPAPQEI